MYESDPSSLASTVTQGESSLRASTPIPFAAPESKTAKEYRDLLLSVTEELQNFDSAPSISSKKFSLADLEASFDYFRALYNTEDMRQSIRFFNQSTRSIEDQTLETASKCPESIYPVGTLTTEQRARALKALRGILTRRSKETWGTISPSDYQELFCTIRSLIHGDSPFTVNVEAVHELFQPTGIILQSGTLGNIEEFRLTVPGSDLGVVGPSSDSSLTLKVAVKNFRRRMIPAMYRETFEPVLHEVFVSTEGIANVYATNPNCPAVFSVSWGAAQCGDSNAPLKSSDETVWCVSRPGVVGIQEVYRGDTIDVFLRKTKSIRVRDLLAVFVLIADGLNVAYKSIRFSHRNLDLEHVVLIDTNKYVSENSFEVQLSTGPRISTRYMPKIVDYSTSRLQLSGVTFGNFTGFPFGIRCSPAADISNFLLRCLSGILRDFQHFDEDRTYEFVDSVLDCFCSITAQELREWSRRTDDLLTWASTAPAQLDNQPIDSIVQQLLNLYQAVPEDEYVYKPSVLRLAPSKVRFPDLMYVKPLNLRQLALQGESVVPQGAPFSATSARRIQTLVDGELPEPESIEALRKRVREETRQQREYEREQKRLAKKTSRSTLSVSPL